MASRSSQNINSPCIQSLCVTSGDEASNHKVIICLHKDRNLDHYRVRCILMGHLLFSPSEM